MTNTGNGGGSPAAYGQFVGNNCADGIQSACCDSSRMDRLEAQVNALITNALPTHVSLLNSARDFILHVRNACALLADQVNSTSFRVTSIEKILSLS